MKFTLKDYQEQAVDDVLTNLKRARENFKNPSKREIPSFSLTATTGAGKTVMAAAAIWTATAPLKCGRSIPLPTNPVVEPQSPVRRDPCPYHYTGDPELPCRCAPAWPPSPPKSDDES